MGFKLIRLSIHNIYCFEPINFHKAETRCTRQNSQELRSSQESQSSEEDGSESSGSKQNREQRSTTPKQYQQRSLTPQRIGEVVIQKKNKAFKQTTRGGDGYSSIPQELAFQLVKISRTIPEVCAERIAYVKSKTIFYIYLPVLTFFFLN